jgi:hypothetical protein
MNSVFTKCRRKCQTGNWVLFQLCVLTVLLLLDIQRPFSKSLPPPWDLQLHPLARDGPHGNSSPSDSSTKRLGLPSLGLTVVDLGHLVHHGDLEDKAMRAGERQELGVHAGKPPLPGALETHGAH